MPIQRPTAAAERTASSRLLAASHFEPPHLMSEFFDDRLTKIFHVDSRFPTLGPKPVDNGLFYTIQC